MILYRTPPPRAVTRDCRGEFPASSALSFPLASSENKIVSLLCFRDHAKPAACSRLATLNACPLQPAFSESDRFWISSSLENPCSFAPPAHSTTASSTSQSGADLSAGLNRVHAQEQPKSLKKLSFTSRANASDTAALEAPARCCRNLASSSGVSPDAVSTTCSAGFPSAQPGGKVVRRAPELCSVCGGSIATIWGL